MKSVELVGSSGFWFCNSVTSKLRNWLDVMPELDEEEVVVAAVVVVVAVVAATVMACSSDVASRIAKPAWAGVTRSSVYHQFHSRDGLFLHLIAESLRSLQRGGDGRRQFASVLDRFLHEAERGFRGDPELLRMFYLLVFDRSWSRPELKRLLREAYRFRTRRLTAGLADDGLRAPRADLEALAIVIAAAFDGLYARSLIDLRGARLKRAFRMLGDLARGAKKRRNTKISGQR